MRRRVYARRVAIGTMTEPLADREIGMMKDILATLEELQQPKLNVVLPAQPADTET